MRRQFDLYEYLEGKKRDQNDHTIGSQEEEESYLDFFNLCEDVRVEINRQYKLESQDADLVTIQRGAIMGHQKEMDFYKDKIRKIILANKMLDVLVPPWYKSLEDGIFAEIFGFCGLTPWIYDEKPEYLQSTSAKIIGENIYFLLEGRCVLQRQKISRQRLDQLKRALLLGYPKERLETGIHEVYLTNGIRVTIFSGDLIKEGEDVLVLRKYVLRNLSFEGLAHLGTIDYDAVTLLEEMAKDGFNVIFSGPVRSGKTTFLQTWQSYEDKSLEGVSISTDTETDWKTIMGDAPFMQLVADGKDMEKVVKPLLRGDNDYIILEEMRDATAFNFAIDITSIGTRRTKATIHSSRPMDIPYNMARKVAFQYGGKIEDIVLQIHKNFHFIFHMDTDRNNPGKKVLASITELLWDREMEKPYCRTLCKFDQDGGVWRWAKESERFAMEKDYLGLDAVNCLKKKLEKLYGKSPLEEEERNE